MNYVRNTWYVAGWAQDFAINKPVGMRGKQPNSG
jgi:hypothetical protein